MLVRLDHVAGRIVNTNSPHPNDRIARSFLAFRVVVGFGVGKTGCPPERGYDLENCVVGAEKAAWFAFIAIGWQRYPLAQASAAVKVLPKNHFRSALYL